VFTGVVREVRASRGQEEGYIVRKDTTGDLVVTADQLPRARQPTAFRITRRWKGVAAGTAYVLNSGACAVTFERGREYLVYARRDEDGTLSTTFCQGTRPVEQAGEDLRALGRPGRRRPE
jgi:hypothetical protein